MVFKRLQRNELTAIGLLRLADAFICTENKICERLPPESVVLN